MFRLSVTVLSSLALVSGDVDLKFPAGFKFGAATSSYQTEGAWNVSGRGESDWDRMIHSDPTSIVDRSNADVACDSYHRWKEDVKIAHDLGLHFYRFSISWTRILPTGLPNQINEAGVRHYSELIEALLEKGIEPVVTMYHNDLPQKLADLGGWMNPLTADLFRDYADVLFSKYADRVKTWITINEPIIVCDFTYNFGTFPPRTKEPVMAPFICNKNILMAHAKAWRLYDEKYRNKYNGKLAMATNPMWIEPATANDTELAELAREFGIGRYSHPVYSKEGGWPPSLEKYMAQYTKRNGLPYSVLPSFTEEEIKFIRGTHDFFALNYYSAFLIRPVHAGEKPGVWFIDGCQQLDAILFSDPKWRLTPFYNIPIVPEGLRRQVLWIHRRYGGVPILISENGYNDNKDNLYDEERVEFVRLHLEQILLSIQEDGTNVTGYTVWSLMDNFEWSSGYKFKFGLYQVDFSDPKRTRTPRVSAHFYRHVIKKHKLEVAPAVHALLRNKPRNDAPLVLGNQFVLSSCIWLLLQFLK